MTPPRDPQPNSPAPSTHQTRRRLLKATLAVGTASLAGCFNPYEPGTGETETAQPNTPSDLGPRGTRIPDQTPAEFVASDGELFYFEALRNPQNNTTSHPDSNAFEVEVSGKKTTLTGKGVFHRPIKFILKIPDESGTTHTYTQLQEKTPTQEPFKIVFDHSDITLKTVTLQRATILATDTHEDIVAKRTVKNQQFIGIPVDDANGNTATYWETSEQLNEEIVCAGYERGDILTGCNYKNENQAVSHESLKNDDYALFVLGQRFINEGEEIGFGVALSYPTKYYNELERLRRTDEVNYSPLEYTYFEDDPYMDDFAQSIADALDELGITEPIKRVEAVGRFAQGLRYKDPRNQALGEYNPLPPVTLDMGYGDCTSKTTLTACILSRDAFGMTPAYIYCKYRGDRHIVLGIDVRDLGLESGETNLYTHKPAQPQIDDGAPDTEYVFFDVTGYRNLGEFNNSAYSSLFFYDTTDLPRTKDVAEPRPNA